MWRISASLAAVLGILGLTAVACGEGGNPIGKEDKVASVRAALTPVFTDATAESGIGLNTGNGIWPGHGSWAGVWADADADGDLDLFTLGHLQPALCGDNQFWRNIGEGKFEEATSEIGMNDRDGADAADAECASGTSEDGSTAAIFQPNISNSCTDGWDNRHRIDTHGAIWADFDRDDDLDLAMVNETITGQPWLYHALWRNDSTAAQESFAEISESADVLGFDHITRGSAAVDYDRDGWLDLFMVTWEAQLPFNGAPDFEPDNLLFHNDGDMKFTDVGKDIGVGGPRGKPCSNPNMSDASCGFQGVCGPNGLCALKRRTAVWFDYDNDGWADLFLNPPCAMFRNLQGLAFEDVTEELGFSLTEECQGAGVADYDNDGDLDLYSSRGFSASVPDVLFRNDVNMTGKFSDVSATAGIDNAPASRAVTWGDYDNDGDDDVYIVTFNKPNQPNKLYQNNGDSTFSDVTTAAAAAAQVSGHGCNIEASTLTREPDYCANWQPQAGDPTSAGGSDASWVDYDGDGDLDLFITNGEANCKGPYVLLNNGGNGNHWLKLDLVGTASNPEAIMARVIVETPAGQRHYMYSGQHHWMAQNKVPLHVGLGTQASVTRVIVTWPNGLQEEFTSIDADTTERLVEGSGTPLGGGGGGGGGGGSGGDGGAAAGTGGAEEPDDDGGGETSAGGAAVSVGGAPGTPDAGAPTSSAGSPINDAGAPSTAGAGGSSNDDSGCGCRVGGESSRASSPLFGFAIGLALWLRRRPRRHWGSNERGH